MISNSDGHVSTSRTSTSELRFPTPELLTF